MMTTADEAPSPPKKRTFARLTVLVVGSLGAAAASLVLLRCCTGTATKNRFWGEFSRRFVPRRLASRKKSIPAQGSTTLSTTDQMMLPPDTPIHIDPRVNPILVLGLPKSGSETIHHFLQCLNSDWKSQHYCCDGSNRTQFACADIHKTCGQCVHDNWLHQRAAFENCGAGDDKTTAQQQQQQPSSHVYAQFDAEAQEPFFEWFLPQHFALPLLHRDYPRAVWILNTRDATKWATNIRHWHSTTLRIFHSFDLDYYDPTINSPTTSALDETRVDSVLPGPVTELELHAELELGWERAHHTAEHERRLRELISVYERHTAKVRDFARNYHHNHNHHGSGGGGALFLEIDMDDDDHNGSKEPPYLKLARGLGFRTPEDAVKAKECWKYDAEALDNDWMDFTIQV